MTETAVSEIDPLHNECIRQARPIVVPLREKKHYPRSDSYERMLTPVPRITSCYLKDHFTGVLKCTPARAGCTYVLVRPLIHGQLSGPIKSDMETLPRPS